MRVRRAASRKTRAFAILLHERPGSDAHYDLVLQGSDAEASAGEAPCFTWSFAAPPGKRAVRCRRIFDHPGRFLTYEGPLREGQGHVRQYDTGTCSVAGDPKRSFLITFLGRRLCGTFRLTLAPEGPEGMAPHGPAVEGEYLWQPGEEELSAQQCRGAAPKP
jgi:hypothetical protein